MISYLSLNRKKPTNDTTILNTAIMPSQFVFQCGFFPSISLEKGLSKDHCNAVILIISRAIEPTPTITKIFCLSFILQFNTIISIIVVTQVL